MKLKKQLIAALFFLSCLFSKVLWATTQLKWDVIETNDGFGGVASSFQWLTGDINGDGLTDLIRRYKDGSRGWNAILLADGMNGWTTVANTDNFGGVGGAYTWLSGDFNGDGLTDIVRRANNGSNRVLLSDGSGGWNVISNPDGYGGVGSGFIWKSGDLNGDGLTDLVRRYKDGSRGWNAILLANGDGRFTPHRNTDNYGGVGGAYAWFIIDVDGDGDDDIVRRGNTGNNAVLLSNGQGGVTPILSQDNFGGVNNDFQWLSGDFDGDGDVDLIRRHKDGTSGYNAILEADGFGRFFPIQNTDSFGGAGGDYLWLSGDVDGDGRSDLVRRGNSGTNNLILISNGGGTWTSHSNTDNAGGVGGQFKWLSGDVNGDGRMDLIRRFNDGSANYNRILTVFEETVPPTPPEDNGSGAGDNDGRIEISSIPFADPGLRTCIEAQTRRLQFADEVTEIYCVNQNVNSLSGLEAFANLERLGAGANFISDVKPLVGLSKLEWLHFGSFNHTNRIYSEDILDLASLPSLKQLFVNYDRDNPPLSSSFASGFGSIERVTFYLLERLHCDFKEDLFNLGVPFIDANYPNSIAPCQGNQ